MDLITKDMIINEVINRYPQTIAVFNKFNVDACCGGGQSIEKTATADRVNVKILLKALNEAINQNNHPKD